MDANSEDPERQFHTRRSNASKTGSGAEDETLTTRQAKVSQSEDDSASAAHSPRDGFANETSQFLPIGHIIGRYQIEQILGRGCMGVVYLARDSQLNRRVALKVPRLNASRGTLAQRLIREARAAATLNHPNICPIFEVGEHADAPFIAMGFVDGRTLAAYVTPGRSLPEREAAKAVRKIALALHEAHSHGILHRDLKPANIMIDQRGEPIVMDFGLAYSFDNDAQARLTQEGMVVGTPAYMSPEQIEGNVNLGPKSDVYSLGVVLYELLSGRCPFEGSVVSVINRVLHQEPPPITELQPDLSPVIVQICSTAMAKNPADRFDSMAEFARTLSTFLKGTPPHPLESDDADSVAMPAMALPAGGPREVAKTRKMPSPVSDKSQQRRPIVQWLLAGSIGAALILALAVSYFAGLSSKDRSTERGAAQADSSRSIGDTREVANDSAMQERSDGSDSVASERDPRDEERDGPRGKLGHRPRGRGPRGGPPRPPGKGPPTFDRKGPAPFDIKRLESLPVDEQFREADRNDDGMLDGVELPMHIIDRADANQDGELAIDELKRGFERLGRDLYGPPSDEERRDRPHRPPPRRGHGPRKPGGPK